MSLFGWHRKPQRTAAPAEKKAEAEHAAASRPAEPENLVRELYDDLPRIHGEKPENVRALSEAHYPRMAQFPGDHDDHYEEKLNAWQAEQRARKPLECNAGLHVFLASAIRTFLSGAEQRNRAVSPLNIYMALAMLAEVTDGDSRRQILDVLGCDSLDYLRQQAGDVWQANYRDDGMVTSILAGSLWLRDDLSYVQHTVDALAEHYYASVYQGVMGSDAMNKALQHWLNEQTGGLLEQQASGEALSADTALALAATAYYKANWAEAFYPENTRTDVFHSPDGDVTCEFMQGSETGSFYWGKNYGVVQKKMRGSEGSMWFMLPDNNTTPEQLLESNEVLAFLLCGGRCRNQKTFNVDLMLPKFDVTSQVDLRAGLQSMGIKDVFSAAQSDFTPLCETVRNLRVDQAKHNVRVTADENGVHAAAYTLVDIRMMSAPPQESLSVRLDRPFLFAITGKNGLPLFVGIVNHPV